MSAHADNRLDTVVIKIVRAISLGNGVAMQGRREESLMALCTLWSRVEPTGQKESTPKQMTFAYMSVQTKPRTVARFIKADRLNCQA